MIYTITLNTALDRTLCINAISPDDANRIESEQLYAGGKGVDVSKVLTACGVGNKALGFVGGFSGEELEGLLINEGIACDFVRISGATRTNIIVNDLSKGSQTIFNARGPEIKPYELMQLIHKVENLDRPEFVIISGSLPPGVNPEIYRKIIEIAKGLGARVVLDTDGDPLRVGLAGGPDIIKPNLHELSRLTALTLSTLTEIVAAARSLLAQGPQIVLVSMGGEGLLLVSGEFQYLAQSPLVEVKNTIGAGDSAVAGFVFGLHSGQDLKNCLAYAAAAGTATILRPGTALCQLADFQRLLPRIVVSEL